MSKVPRLVRRLRTRERQYRRMLDVLPYAVLLDADGEIRYANQAAAQLLGADASDQLIGRRYAELLVQTMAAGASAEHQTWRRADGSMIEVEALAQIIEHRRPVLRQTTLRASQSTQAQRMEAVGRLASGIAHDFNNLVTAIHGHAQFLADELAADHPARFDVEEVLHSAERAAALTRQLLAFSRGQSVEPESIQINTVVTAMERLLRRVISEDISVDSELDRQLWNVRADPSQIEQIVVNLVVNARDALPRGGRITIRTANVELEPGDYVMLSVSDTGIGMDNETRARIFEPFFSTKEPGERSGLGLSSVLSSVQQLRGHIEIQSEPGHGTTFEVYIPATRLAGEADLNRPQSRR